MHKTLMLGLILFSLYSCSSAHIKEPQPVYVINFKFGSVVKGQKNFNYKDGPEKMTEWVGKATPIKWSEMPENVIAFDLKTWLTRIKPALKKLSRRFRDKND